MFRRALLAAAAILAMASEPAFAGLNIVVEADGSSYFENASGAPLSFDGYQIASETNELDPVGWKSLSDSAAADPLGAIAFWGAGVLTFGEANPGPGALAELNLGGLATIQPGATWSIGKPFASLPPNPATIDYFVKTPGGLRFDGEIIYKPDTPEPSTFVLAALAGLCLVVFRRRVGREAS